jgi:hypothetical protein
VIECPTCSFENSEDSNFCRRCGERLGPGDLGDTTLTYVWAEREGEEGDTITPLEHPGPVLLIRGGGGREGEIVALDLDVVSIGRSPDNELFLDDVTVSRHHARVIRDSSGYVVEDLNSLNGTYVNRRRIEHQGLSDGDELQVGKYKMAFIEQAGHIPEEQ